MSWNILYACTDVEVAANIFTDILKSIFDKQAPFKSKIVKGKPAPWLKADLRQLIIRRDKALRKSRKTNSKTDVRAYKDFRNQCNRQLKEAKRKYHQNLINDSRGNAKKFWNAIKNVFPSNSKSQTTGTLNKNDTEKTANVFSSYFASAVKIIKSKITIMTNLVWTPHPIRHKTRKVFKLSYVSKGFV